MHQTHLDRNLPFSILVAAGGFGVRSRTNDFHKLSMALAGNAILIPSPLVSTEETKPLRQALRNYCSIIEISKDQLFAGWGPFSVVNHDCSSMFELVAPFGEDHTPRQGKIYKWKIQARSEEFNMDGEIQPEGKELFLYYRSCKEGGGDFVCKSCAEASDER